MIKVFIDIAGPGVVINRQVDLVVKAMTDAGFSVMLNNSHPDDPKDSDVKIQGRDGNNFEINIKAEHCPWGG